MRCFLPILLIILRTAAAAQPLFTLLPPKQTRIDFNNEINETGAQNVLAYEYLYNGGGVAIADINNDGLADIFFTGNMVPNKLYLNLGGCRFKDITRQAGVAGRKGWKTGVTVADVNADGLADFYVCYSGRGEAAARKNQLFINKGNLSFADEAKNYGLDDEGCSTQAIFFDYDIDGDLDMYLLNHNTRAYKNVELQHLKTAYDSLAADKLYRNDEGHFTDVSREAGISGNPISFGLGVAVSDVNNDGWPDIYVSNDYTEQDYLYINNANGTFTAREHYMLSHLSQFSMGSDIADFNNDGLVDILTLDMLPEDNRRQKLLQAQENYELYQQMATNGFHYQFMRNMLHLNNGNGTFSEIGQLAGVSNTDWSWSALFADLDNDGNKDIFITNGYMRDYTNKDFMKYWGDYLVKQVVKRDSIDYMEIVKMMPSTLLSNYVFRNDGNLGFSNATKDWGLDQVSLSNGAAYADLDNDGDLDLVVNNINGPAFVYRNESTRQHYLQVQLRGAQKNSLGIGAKLYCYAAGKMQLYEQMPTRGYQSSVSTVLHIGLGQAEKIDSLKVIWLNGSMQVLKNIPADTLLMLEQAQAKTTYLYRSKNSPRTFTRVKPFIDYTHLQLDYNDFKRQPLMPVMQSQCGPAMAVGDVNGDGREDVIVGASQGQGDALYLQQEGAFFLVKEVSAFAADSNANTTQVLLVDVDGDKDLDVWMTTGGYNDYVENDERLQDRLFLNDGSGNFTLAAQSIPAMFSAKSCVAAADIDGDRDMDIFVGGRNVPGNYPAVSPSYLLLNDGSGKFSQVPFQSPGIITCAKWTDVNKDGRPDLIVAGEWMAPMLYLNLPAAGATAFTLSAVPLDLPSGWWNTIELADIDNDGDEDIIAGNWGLNSQVKASWEEPAELICKDFDNNGSLDPLLCFYIQGKTYPYVSRDELIDQVYPLRRKFTSYKSYADATVGDVFTAEELKDAMRLQATELRTMLFINENGKFIQRELPMQAQFAPVYRILSEDVNGDGAKDLLLFGNNDYARLKIGKIDANFGTLLLNDGTGHFRYVPQDESGLKIAGDVKDASMLAIGDRKFLLVGINNASLAIYLLNR